MSNYLLDWEKLKVQISKNKQEYLYSNNNKDETKTKKSILRFILNTPKTPLNS